MVDQTRRKSVQSGCVLVLLFFGLTVSAQTTDNYQPGPDSKPQPGVPKGEVLKFTFDNSKSFRGLLATIGSTYLPSTSPTNLHVFTSSRMEFVSRRRPSSTISFTKKNCRSSSRYSLRLES